MNLKSTSVFAGLIAGSALALSTLPAQAFTFNPNGTINVAASETIKFDFVESRGMFQSSFGIYSAPSAASLVTTLFTENAPGYDLGRSDANGDWLGTCGITVTPAPCKISYTFANAGSYYFGLSSPDGSTIFTNKFGTFASAAEADLTPPESSAFISDAKTYTRSTIGPSSGGGGFTTLDLSKYAGFVAINDSAALDKDVQDFIVAIQPSVQTVPEPATLAGLGLVAGAMTMLRRRKRSQVS